MNNIERDENRIKEFYIIKLGRKTSVLNWFDCNWFYNRYSFLGGIPDISEEFHRKYCKFYDTTDHWFRVFMYQTALSDKFYDDSFDIMDYLDLTSVIKNGRVSKEWIEKNLYRIPETIWKEVYK